MKGAAASFLARVLTGRSSPAKAAPGGLMGRLAALGKAPWLPLLLLLLALSTVFLFGNDRGRFYRGVGPHDGQTSKYVALAANLSYEHDLLVFQRRTLDAEGAPSYEPYNRFPIGGYLLIKLAITPFADSLSAQIQAARALMLLCFAATALLAYLSLCRLTAQRWIALTASLLSFSSTWWLYASDMVSTEMGLDLFGLMLCFHGMVIFAQEGRFRQLLARTGVALLLGWHVYALLLPFVLLGLGKELAGRLGKMRGFSLGAWLRPAVVALLRSRHLALGAFALLFGLAVLSFNFVGEHLAMNGKTAISELPSVQSMLKRTGLEDAEEFPWKRFIERQLHRIGGMSLPYALPGYDHSLVGWPEGRFAQRGQAIGILVCCLALMGLAFARHRMLLATLALSGFCWTLPMRHSTFLHNFESLSYTGLALVFFALILLWLHRLFGQRLTAALAAAALFIFAYSSARMAQLGYDAKGAQFQADAMADFEVIRRMTEGYTVFIPRLSYNASFSGTYMTTNYYLSGSIILYVTEGDRRHLADFLVTRQRQPGRALLTPDNRLFFLYDRAAYDRQWMARLDNLIAQAGEPLLRSDFDVYLHGNRLIYAKDPCRADDLRHKFFLHLIPTDPAALPPRRRQHGFDNLDFHFASHGLYFDGKCAAAVALPDYDIANIRTGQHIAGGDAVWRADLMAAP